ncbi:hypothetical protein [Gramella sp. MAR_2010_147]|uniref:hypothetical protein n=1 Tax=Gramella sp. MAR_2010_147 TaxID=1250205 RepID=UPI00087C12E8|nr:hypothetical protein [Gramella sp. MAR_2010_147]SDS58122.1 hypothetical protein SAMN04488553_2586 [Gramella sp. MAR_2010_147]
MAPIKFEEHIKEKLDEREIQPSAESWEKLDSRLNRPEKSSGRKVWIPSIAAIMLLLIASLLFVNQQEQKSAPVVETPAEEKIQKKSKESQFEEPIELASEETSIDARSESEKIVRNTAEKFVNPQRNQSAPKTTLASNPVQKRDVLMPVSIENISEEVVVEVDLSLKVQELLASISKAEKKSGKRITESEVDALLAEAVKEISKNTPEKYSGNFVDAENLLADVEYDVDQSFRKEVFEFLKEEFKKARTAVATRND